MGIVELMDAANYKMQTFKTDDLSIELNCHGNTEYTKVSYPVKYGLFSRLETNNYIFEFNLNHEIRHAKSKKKAWIHPSEWLKRTLGNDWVYYSTGGYSGVYEALGEYYLPNLMYPTNSLLGGKPFKENEIDQIVRNWHQIIAQLPGTGFPDPVSRWIWAIKQQTPEGLHKKAQTLFDISGSRVTVMPPDARHVDYNIIPLNISDGCLYKCQFCKVKNKKKFSVRSEQDIDHQIKQLKQLYGKDLINFNALFLGEHDALNAPCELILKTVQKAYDAFEFQASVMKKNYLFMFGSADSFLTADKTLFETLNRMPFQTFINIGLESYDQATLDLLGKPLTRKQVEHAFQKIRAVNDTFPNIEITCNFVMDETLPDSHYEAVMTLIRENVNRTKPKGCVYLSPLKFGSPSRQVLYDFYKLKSLSRFPTFLYIIQRL
ncbi:radical SAM protein [Desulfobacula sp.]|uniref:radical SAM protein n=2 Tax=Desulfobacula sp. TaxID=2593537 RepID=UPI0027155700|nr:radical SAM protein [Desulfobacula sp.]